jgi:hypothetical protein
VSEQRASGGRIEGWRAERRSRRESRRLVVGVLLVAVGAAFLLQTLGVWTVRGDVVWPLILIALGVTLVLGVWPWGRRRG